MTFEDSIHTEWDELVAELGDVGLGGEVAELLTVVQAWADRTRVERGDEGELHWLHFERAGETFSADLGANPSDQRAFWDGEAPYRKMVLDLIRTETLDASDWIVVSAVRMAGGDRA